MIQNVNKHHIVEELSEYLQFKPSLRDGQYFIHEISDTKTIMWTTNPNISSLLNRSSNELITTGLPIYKFEKNKLVLYPPFIECLSDEYEVIKVTLDQAHNVSFGERIHVNSDDGLYILTDQDGERIAFGYVSGNKFDPLIDLGWYLREGN